MWFLVLELDVKIDNANKKMKKKYEGNYVSLSDITDLKIHHTEYEVSFL